MSEDHPKFNRRIAFLKKRGHTIEVVDKAHVNVDNCGYELRELEGFINAKYRDEWVHSENEYLKSVAGMQ